MPIRGHEGISYWVGEKPRPLLVKWTDEDGALDASIAGATLVAKTRIAGESADVDVSMTNNADGTMTIDWPTGTSRFALIGTAREQMMSIDILVTEAPRAWYMDRFSVPVRLR